MSAILNLRNFFVEFGLIEADTLKSSSILIYKVPIKCLYSRNMLNTEDNCRGECIELISNSG